MLKNCSSEKIISNEQLVARIRAGENEAENMLQLWQQNKGFIATLARKYSVGAEMEDLEQEGYIGLCDAICQYDSDRGMSFISYAAFYIHRRMRTCVDNNRAVHIPFGADDEIRRYKKVRREYEAYYGCEPTNRELCVFLGVEREKVEQIKKTVQMGKIRSLSEPVPGMEGESNLADTVASGEDIEEDVIKRVDTASMKKELWLAVDQLPEKQSNIIRKRYQDRMTLKEAGQSLGVSIEAVRSIENKAMRTLRIPHRCRKFRVYYEEYLAAACYKHVGVESFQRTWYSEVEKEVLGGV